MWVALRGQRFCGNRLSLTRCLHLVADGGKYILFLYIQDAFFLLKLRMTAE